MPLINIDQLKPPQIALEQFSALRRDSITTSGVHYFSNNSTACRQLFLT